MDADTPKSFEEMLDRLYAECKAICIERQRKYGPGNIQRHMLHGVVVRMDDKLSRLGHLLFNGGKASKDESIDDTLIDGANYNVIGLAIRRGWWTKTCCPPLQETKENQ